MLREDRYTHKFIPPNSAEPVKATKPKKHFKLIKTNDLMAKDFPSIQWAIPGFVPEGLSILAGRQKLGKSWLAFDWAIAVATGGIAMGSIECRCGDVLYIDMENGERRIQRRINALLPDRKSLPELGRLKFATESPSLNDGFIDALDDWRTSVLEPKLVVVDVLQRIKPAGSLSRNSYENDYSIISPLQRWATDHGVAAVLITHTRKGGADDPLEAVTGSNGLSACADATLVLDRKAEGATLYVRGRDVEERDDAMRFDQGRWWVMGDAAEVHNTSERSAYIELLREAKEPMGPSDIAAALGKNANEVKQMLHRLGKNGEVERTGRGRYIHRSRTDLMEPRNL
jgi:AAA domain